LTEVEGETFLGGKVLPQTPFQRLHGGTIRLSRREGEAPAEPRWTMGNAKNTRLRPPRRIFDSPQVSLRQKRRPPTIAKLETPSPVIPAPPVIPAKAGIHPNKARDVQCLWIPAFAGMTRL